MKPLKKPLLFGVVSLLVLIFFAGTHLNSVDPIEETVTESGLSKYCNKTGDSQYECALPGWSKRDFDIYLPSTSAETYPAILVLHGGGGNKEAAIKLTCPDGDFDSSNCLSHLATSRGFAVVVPNGTGRPISPNIRTFNAGGGTGGLVCVSGYACSSEVDDIQYFSDLVTLLRGEFPIGSQKIFVTGFSNGAAMTFRLACELGAEFSGIAPVSAANQFEAATGCPQGVPMPLLQIHGTADPCWPYEGGKQICVPGETNHYTDVAGSLDDWRIRNACTPTTVSQNIDDRDPTDATISTRYSYTGCLHDVTHIEISGGGHTWPQGYIYGRRDDATSMDFSATAEIVTFFENNL